MKIKKNKLNEILFAAGSASLISLMASGINFASNVLIARLYGENAYAEFSFLFSLLTVMALVVTLGTGQMLIMNLPLLDKKKSSDLIGRVNLFLLSALIIVSPILAYYLLSAGYSGFLVICFIGTLMLLSTSSTRQSIYFSHGKVVLFQFLDKLVKIFLFCISIFLFHFSGSKDVEYLILALFFACFTSTLFLISNRQMLDLGILRLGGKLSFSDIKASIQLYGVLIVTTLLTNIDVLVLKNIGTNAELAYFSAAQKLSFVGNIFLISITSIITPILVKSEGGENTDFNSYAKYSTLIGFFSLLLFMIGSCFFGVYALNLFGQDFSKGYSSLVVLVFSSLLSAFFGQTFTIMKIKKEVPALLIYMILAILLKSMIFYYFYLSFNIVGVAFSTVVAVGFWNLLCHIHLKFKYGINTTVLGVLKL